MERGRYGLLVWKVNDKDNIPSYDEMRVVVCSRCYLNNNLADFFHRSAVDVCAV